MSNYHVGKKGVFREKKRKPGEKTKDGNMPDIFKIERQASSDVTEEPKILVTNQEGNWKAEIPISQAPIDLLTLLADRTKIYIIAIPDKNGLVPLSMKSDQGW